MPISPIQCRSARALLSWSQDDLEVRSSVAKKTIADFERDARVPHSRNISAIKRALEDGGVVFIPQNGGGEGVRIGVPVPRLFRRNDVPPRQWVAFAFDYRAKRWIGFVTYDALLLVDVEERTPTRAFDEAKPRILRCAAEKADRSDLDSGGRVVITPEDLHTATN